MSPSRQAILLVEDRSDDVLLLQRVLKQASLGRPFNIVSSGEEAIAYLDGQGEYADRRAFPSPTLIFLDLKLPGISGFEVLTWIRQQPRLDRLQIIVLTGSRHTIDVYRAYELGANSYLAKPVDLPRLTDVIHSLNLNRLSFVEAPQAMTPAKSTPVL